MTAGGIGADEEAVGALGGVPGTWFHPIVSARSQADDTMSLHAEESGPSGGYRDFGEVGAVELPIRFPGASWVQGV